MFNDFLLLMPLGASYNALNLHKKRQIFSSRSAIYSDSVSTYVTMKKYRGSTYANNSSGWVLLDAAEQVFKITKERVYNDKDGKFTCKSKVFLSA